MILCID